MSDKQLVQHDLVASGRVQLESLWLEVGPVCHLHCQYCFSDIEAIDSTNSPSASLTAEEIEERVIRPFADAGGKWISIPGAGEPLLGSNLVMTKRIVEASQKYGLHLTIFTAGDLIDESLAKYLAGHAAVDVMVKWNSSDADVQDALVGGRKSGYAARRETGWATLLAAFSEDRQRLGIVTSIMNANLYELPDLMRKANREGVRFDCDVLLPEGRGLHSRQAPEPAEIRSIIGRLAEVSEELGLDWRASGAYVNSPCNRYKNHLYVRHDGSVCPCVGSFHIDLGNVRDSLLMDIWGSSIRQAYAVRRVVGACAICKRFIDGECASCVGRNAVQEGLERMLQDGVMPTMPCALFVPNLSLALQAAGLYIRTSLLDSAAAEKLLAMSFEAFWALDGGWREAQSGPVEECEVINFDMLTENVDGGMDDIRKNGLRALFAWNSPISLFALVDGVESRYTLSPEGFLNAKSPNCNSWIDGGSVLDLGSNFPSFLDGAKDSPIWAGPETSDVQWLVKVRSDLFDAMSVCSRGKQGLWTVQARRGSGNDAKEYGLVDFEVKDTSSGVRLPISEAAVAKTMRMSQWDMEWSEWFRVDTGEFLPPRSGGDALEREELMSLIPRVLAPLTTLVLKDRAKPLWVLWLFYDPCRNAYFRRLFINQGELTITGGGDLDQDINVLRVLYGWAEPDMEFVRRFDLNVDILYERNIINLSDILRDPLLDYELVCALRSKLAGTLRQKRFAVGGIVDHPSIVARAGRLLDVARNALCPDTRKLVDRVALRQWRVGDGDGDGDQAAAKELAAALLEARECLFLEGGDRQDISELWGLIDGANNEGGGLTEQVMDAYQSGIRASEDKANVQRRLVNYFVWMAAFALMGAKHYYVAQHLSHSLTPSARDWRDDSGRVKAINPSGFIVATRDGINDDVVADLRLVFDAVHAPFVERFATWVSDYSEIRARARVLRNMPCLQRFPLHYLNKLQADILRPNRQLVSGETIFDEEAHDQEFREDLQWIQRLPKSDLHVHLGPAIPVNILYDISWWTLTHLKCEVGNGEKIGRVAEACAELIATAVMQYGKVAGTEDPVARDDFRQAVLTAARQKWGADSIYSVNVLLRWLRDRYGVSEELVVSVFNALLGMLIRPKWDMWEASLSDKAERIGDFLEYLTNLQSTEDGEGQGSPRERSLRRVRGCQRRFQMSARAQVRNVRWRPRLRLCAVAC